MSLLLDALKKAAQEKQEASGAEKKPDKNEDELELSLDEQETAELQSSEPHEAEALSVEPPLELEKTTATTSTVSDEALQLLIYKTNKQHRRTKRMIWGGSLAAAIILLILGGVYYYYVMVEEVEALERKHAIAMRLFESHEVKSTPRVPIMVVDDGQLVQKTIAKKSPVKTRENTPRITSSPRPHQSAEAFSIKRTQKSDPVSALLNKAWRAYGNTEYSIAADAYNKVLEREPRNRDALLGKAAIAVKQGDYAQARVEYRKLLQLDPRDQIAMSALSNLDEVTPDTLSETKLKFMLQQQPDAAHLHFALGNFYAKQSRWPEAQSGYFNAWQGDSENPDYAFNLAVSLDQLGKKAEAKRFYEKSLNLSVGRNINFSIEAVKARLNKIAAR